jgi:hypothetical protein
MKYEGSIGFVMRKMKKKIIADFHVLGLFMVKKHVLSDRKNSVCYAPAVAVRKICTSPKGSALIARKLKCWFPESFGPT